MSTDSSWIRGLAVLATALVVGCGSGNEADLLASAKAKLAQSDVPAAVIQLKSALEINGSSAEGRFLLGKALQEQGSHAASLVELNKAKDLGYNEIELLPVLAQAMLANGKFKETIDAFAGKSMAAAPAQSALRTAVSVAYARLGKRKEAEAAIAEALAADPKSQWALMTKARLLAGKADFDGALSLVEQSMVAGQTNGEVWALRGSLLLYARKDVDGAIKAYREAIKDPKHALEGHMSIVGIYIALQKPVEAKAQFEEMKKAFPNSPQTTLVETELAYKDKNFAKARELMQQMLRLAPDNLKLLALSGAIDLQRGALLAAESQLGRVVQANERAPGARKLLAETYLRMGQPDKALGALRPLLEGEQRDAQALAYAGEAQLQKGNATQAVAMFGAAAKLRPNDIQLRTAMALTDLAKGKADVAFDALRNIAANDAGDAADLALISARMKRREFNEALAAIALLEKKQPGKATAAALRGQVLRQSGDASAARAAFEDAVKVEPNHIGALLSLTALDLGENKADAARARLETAAKANPTNSSIKLAVVEVLRRQGAKPEDIQVALVDAVKANPTDVSAQLALIEHNLRNKDFKAALAAGQGALAALPDNPEILDALGLAQVNSGDDQQAISTFNRLASLQPRSPTPHLRLADLYARRKDEAARLLSLKRAFDVAPESDAVHRQLIVASLQSKDARIALDAAKDLQKRQPGHGSGYLFEGDAEASRKNWSPAIAAYKRALDKDSPAGQAAVRVYQAHVAAGQVAEADKFATEWLKSHPKDVALLERLGSDAFARNDLATAERRYQQVLSIEPNEPLALNNVAWMMVERNAKGALALAERAAALAPESALVLDTLSKALAAEGKFDRAIEVQRQAVSLADKRYDYRLRLAKLYIKAGDKTRARSELDGLSALGAKYQAQAEVASLLKSLGN